MLKDYAHNDIFILGTGTDVGKTYVSALLINSLNKDGYNFGYFKPVVSGGMEDPIYVKEETGLPDSLESLVSYAFKPPLSPHLAAGDTVISPKKIKENFLRLKEVQDERNLIIEGCGGIFCPIYIDDKNPSKNIFLKDIVKIFDCFKILVAPAGLGSLNSIFTALSYGKLNNIEIDILILNNFSKDSLICNDNLHFLKKYSGISEIFTVENSQLQEK